MLAPLIEILLLLELRVFGSKPTLDKVEGGASDLVFFTSQIDDDVG